MAHTLKNFIKEILDDYCTSELEIIGKRVISDDIIEQLLAIYDSGNITGFILYFDKNKEVKIVPTNIHILTRKEEINEQ